MKCVTNFDVRLLGPLNEVAILKIQAIFDSGSILFRSGSI